MSNCTIMPQSQKYQQFGKKSREYLYRFSGYFSYSEVLPTNRTFLRENFSPLRGYIMVYNDDDHYCMLTTQTLKDHVIGKRIYHSSLLECQKSEIWGISFG